MLLKFVIILFWFPSDKMATVLNESNSYYFKCIARHRALLNISTPSKVSKPNLDVYRYSDIICTFIEINDGSDIKV